MSAFALDTNKKKRQNCKLAAFPSKFKPTFQKLIFKTELREKCLTLNYGKLKTVRRRNFEFGENAFYAFLQGLREKFCQGVRRLKITANQVKTKKRSSPQCSL